jgi:hypothetical protein
MLHVFVDAQEGFPEPFRAILIPGLHEIPQFGAEPVSVISTPAGETLVVPSSTVHEAESPQAEAYRREWATLTGKSEREIYVPEALR